MAENELSSLPREEPSRTQLLERANVIREAIDIANELGGDVSWRDIVPPTFLQITNISVDALTIENTAANCVIQGVNTGGGYSQTNSDQTQGNQALHGNGRAENNSGARYNAERQMNSVGSSNPQTTNDSMDKLNHSKSACKGTA